MSPTTWTTQPENSSSKTRDESKSDQLASIYIAITGPVKDKRKRSLKATIVTSRGEHSSEEDIEDSSDSESARKRTRQDLTTPYSANDNGSADQTSHADIWVDILEYAKKQFLLWLVTRCPWPQLESHLVNADICLTEAVETWREKGKDIDEGTSLIIYWILQLSSSF